MRIMPFMKRKKGVQFAGIGLDTGGGGGGSLPIASADTLGAVKIGENLNITSEGVLSASGGGEPDYVASEVATGQKWVDGSTIYRRVVTYSTVEAHFYDVATGLKALPISSALGHNSANINNSTEFEELNFMYYGGSGRVVVEKQISSGQLPNYATVILYYTK